MRVLCVAAHPDDETLGCGGTLHRCVEQGHDVRVVTFTNGGDARKAGCDRRGQLHAAAFVIGFKVLETFNFRDNAMDDTYLLSFVKSLESIIALSCFVPDVVLTHSHDCLNVDHRRVFETVEVVFRSSPCKIMTFPIPSSSELRMSRGEGLRPNAYVVLSEQQVKMKLRALEECYGSEMRPDPHSRSLENIERLMRTWGAQVGVKYAEQFTIVKEVI